jgi:hypothetical protein
MSQRKILSLRASVPEKATMIATVGLGLAGESPRVQSVEPRLRKYKPSTFSLAQGVFRRNFRLDLTLAL